MIRRPPRSTPFPNTTLSRSLLADTDYRRVLRKELESRCRTSPRYSLRAFARDLKISPSRLSEILSGKQGLSRAAARGIRSAEHTSELQSQSNLVCRPLLESK